MYPKIKRKALSDFLNDIFDIEWHKWKYYLAVTFVLVVLGSVVGCYLARAIEYFSLFKGV